MSWQQAFSATPADVRRARRFVAGLLDDVAPEVVDNVVLMVSELATNCVRHARTPFRITVERSDGRLRVEVADSGERPATMRGPGPEEPTGRGIQIVSSLSERWGATRAVTGGNVVWFTLATDQPPSSQRGRPMTHPHGAR